MGDNKSPTNQAWLNHKKIKLPSTMPSLKIFFMAVAFLTVSHVLGNKSENDLSVDLERQDANATGVPIPLSLEEAETADEAETEKRDPLPYMSKPCCMDYYINGRKYCICYFCKHSGNPLTTTCYKTVYSLSSKMCTSFIG